MFFGSRIPLKTLAILCRSLSTMLEAGVPLRRTLSVASKKTPHAPTRKALEAVSEQIDAGSDVESALRTQDSFFPTLFLDMVGMAETSGAVPEVLKHLADHYDNTVRMKKEFVQSIAWPGFQYVAANLVIALLILIIGMVTSSNSQTDMSFLVFGLEGPGGAALWLFCSLGFIAGLFVLYKVSNRFLEAKKIVDPILMKVPVLGHCMRCFAIARFSWAYYLTQQTGMPVVQSLTDSLKATGNGAFTGMTYELCSRVQEGATITEAFASTRLFPEEYIEMVSVAEESGTVPEALYRLSPQFEEDARRSMRVLTKSVAVLTWLAVAGFIIMFIFRFFMWYVDQINDVMKDTY